MGRKPQRHDVLVRVAELYYIKKKSQQEIADIMHASRSSISKMLKTCVDQGIVEFKVNSLSSSGIRLQHELKKHFNLKDVVLVSPAETLEETKSSVGSAAADYLESQLQNNLTLGVAWGTTPYLVGSHFNPDTIYDIDVIQLIGGIGARSIDTDGQELVKLFQKHFHGTGYVLQAPLIVKNPLIKQMLMEEPEIKNHFKKVKQVDIALLGLGSNRSNLSAIHKSGHIKKTDADDMLKMGAVGDVCGTQVDINGNVCQTKLSDRVIAIDMDTLLKVPTRIGVAAGPEKADIILASLRGKSVNVLITDEVAAKKVLEYSTEDSPDE